MSTTYPCSLRTHADWIEWIKKGKSGTDRPIGSNSRARIDGAGDVVLRYYNTDVVIYGADGTLTLAHEGWVTARTFQFIDRFAPGRHFRSKGRVFSMLTNGKTEPKVWKCRTCKGEGSGTYTYTIDGRWVLSDNPANPMRYERYETPEVKTDDWTCYRCDGTGRADYGSKPLYLRWDLPFMTFDLNDNDPKALVPTAAHTWAVAG